MSEVRVEAATKRYGMVAALDAVSVDFAEGEFFGLLGPSGSGKTTLLRAIAGFVELDSGKILIDGQPVEDRPPHRREIGMVFQSYALFPHLSVAENIGFGLSVRGRPRATITAEIERLLALVQLSGLEGRKPKQLSGGQQQRVALARALATRPRVLLLDEPLGALDKKLRQEMQIELKQIQREVGITTIFVTHDQEEALTLSDRIAILDKGKIVQMGAPTEVYERPRTVFAAGFLGEANFLAGRAVAIDRIAVEGLGEIRTTDPLTPGQEATLAVRPEKIAIELTARGDAGENQLRGVIRQAIFSGSSVSYRIGVGPHLLSAFQQNRSAAPLAVGSEVTLSWAPRHCVAVAP